VIAAEPEAGTHAPTPTSGGEIVIGILIAVLLAALVYFLCTALGLPVIIGIVAAILVLLAGIPTGGYGMGNRWGGRSRL
jgi:hypothetical protein